jgi:glutathione-regulated potassium-efflux system ancillary protein KefG
MEKSRIHRRLVRNLPNLAGLTFHDLYEQYPNFDVDVPREQELLLAHDLVILQHPFFWYSTPALVKEWEDLVLEHGWAYGSKGKALHGKKFLSLISAGGTASAYERGGYNCYTIREFLAPLEQTARLCGMDYLPPYVIHGTHRMHEDDLNQAAMKYRRMLILLHDDRIDYETLRHHPTLNEALEQILDAEEVA